MVYLRRCLVLTFGAVVACAREAPTRPAPVVVAATGEPESVFPPLVVETVGRDVSDLVFERLADIEPGGAPVNPGSYRPRLAAAWEQMDSLHWRFHLAEGARWADGRPVTSDDVVFSFGAFGDSMLNAPARSYIAGRVTAIAESPRTVVVQFSENFPEQLYDATYHVRIVPRHIWDTIPRARWAADTSVARLVGTGPFHVAEWKRGEYLRLRRREGDIAGETSGRQIEEVVWRFAADPDAAVNLVLSHEADLMELAAAPQALQRVAADEAFEVQSYPSVAYGFLGFNLLDRTGGAHPVFDRATRRALAQAVDRQSLARATFGPGAVAPPGPMSRLLWIWDDALRPLPFDTAAAAHALDVAGWRVGARGVRRRGARDLAFDILVPGTSATRRQLAVALQAAWRRIGADVSVSAVDFPIFQERLGSRRFDSYIGAWLDEPSARGLADQWTRAGWEGLNYGRYANPAFDALFRRAAAEPKSDAARRLYSEAMDTLNADAPAIFLYNPGNAAAVSRRLEGVEIDPYSWLSGLPDWRVRR